MILNWICPPNLLDLLKTMVKSSQAVKMLNFVDVIFIVLFIMFINRIVVLLLYFWEGSTIYFGGINDEQRCWTSLLSGWTKFGCHRDALATVLLMFPCWNNRHHSKVLKTAWLFLVLRRTQVVCEVHFWGTTCYTSMVVIGRCKFCCRYICCLREFHNKDRICLLLWQ